MGIGVFFLAWCCAALPCAARVGGGIYGGGREQHVVHIPFSINYIESSRTYSF